MATYFISDLHLSDTTPSLNAAFSDFMQNTSADADQIFILGDLFEAWLGDDDDSKIGKHVAELIRQRTDNGTHVFLMRGNRDFMLSEQYAESLGAQLLSDPTILNIEGQDIALMHGDSLCTDDKDYQRFRRIIQHPFTRWFLAKLPLNTRRKIGGGLRTQSDTKKEFKASEIMDVNLDTVQKFCFDHEVKTIIHGHTHRPDTHKEKAYSRYVLGDWGEYLWLIRMTQESVDLVSQSILAGQP